MIVNAGKDIIKNVFGGQLGAIATHIALGTGTAPAALTDTALQTEVARVTLDSIAADLANDRIVFKGTLQPGLIVAFTEIGLVSVSGASQVGVLVARVVLDDPETPDASLPTEIEYSLEISV